MKRIFLLCLMLHFMILGICYAEVKVFSSTEKSDVLHNETIDEAKERVKHYALRAISESAGVYVESYTKVENQEVRNDIVTIISSNVIKVNSVEYSPILYGTGGQREISATVTATVDTENILQMSRKLQTYENELRLANEKLRVLQEKIGGDPSHPMIENSIPNIIISHNALLGEVDVNDIIMKAHLVPSTKISIHKEPYETSPLVGSASAGDVLNVIATEIHSFPQRGKTRIINKPFEDFIHIRGKYSSVNKGKILPSIGEYIYLIRYMGEGVYQALYRDNMIMVPYNGIKNISDRYDKDGIHRGFYAVFDGDSGASLCEEWICVRSENGLEGWILFNSQNDWKLPSSIADGNGIFHYNRQI